MESMRYEAQRVLSREVSGEIKNDQLVHYPSSDDIFSLSSDTSSSLRTSRIEDREYTHHLQGVEQEMSHVGLESAGKGEARPAPGRYLVLPDLIPDDRTGSSGCPDPTSARNTATNICPNPSISTGQEGLKSARDVEEVDNQSVWSNIWEQAGRLPVDILIEVGLIHSL